MSENEDDYPEHEKLMKVKDESQTIGSFLEWLRSETCIELACRAYVVRHAEGDPIDGLPDYVVPGPHVNDTLYTVTMSINDLLARYYDVDLEKLDEEKRGMMSEMRGMQQEGET